MATCPKCGFEQASGRECLRCGVIFDRYRPSEEPPPAPEPLEETEEKSAPGAFIRFYRVFRWVVLAGAALVLFLILYQSPPPHIDADPQAPQRLESKLQRLDRALRRGQPHTLRLDEAEVNSWLQSKLTEVLEDQTGSSAELDSPAAPEQIPVLPGNEPTTEPTIEEVKSNVRDIKIDLVDDLVRAYVVFNLYGKDMSLLVEGRLRVEDGYLRLDPTAVKLGSLPIPQATVDRAVRRLFDSPENKEKFRLPPYIRDLRVENGEIVVSYR